MGVIKMQGHSYWNEEGKSNTVDQVARIKSTNK